jgi:transposase
MEQATTIGLDIAKHVFQVHGADAAGHVLFRKRITRRKLLGFLAAQARCVVAMEACAGAHYWAREIGTLGHHVRLIAPPYVKPFIRRQKNDAADAEAICEQRSGRTCASFRSRAKSSRRTASCSEPAISWYGSAPSASTRFAGT